MSKLFPNGRQPKAVAVGFLVQIDRHGDSLNLAPFSIFRERTPSVTAQSDRRVRTAPAGGHD